MAGRKPLPTHIKLLKGNPGKRSVNAREPKPKRGVPKMPAHLTPRAKSAWKRIGPELDAMGVLSLADATALELLCCVYAEWRVARDTVDDEGTTYTTTTETGDTMYRTRPEVAIAADAWRRCRAMLAEFGLTPSSRSKVSRIGDPASADPFETFLGQAKR